MMRLAVMAAAFWLATPCLALAQDAAEEPAARAEPEKRPSKLAPRRREPAKEKPKPATPAPFTPMAAEPELPPPNLTVLCEGKPARYAAATGVPIWVLRSGIASVENPLRPLTPETTRVLQVVVGDRNATAYGPDLAALRRGGIPAALEARLGAPIRWDEALTLLPDTFVIVSEAGETLARLPFRDCSDAPATKPDPVQRVPKPEAKASSDSPSKPRRPASPAEPKAPKGLHIPQGAIAAPPEGRP